MKLSANNLKKKYGQRYVVDDISISLNTGEIVGLLGPNGAGKTTTLRMIGTMLQPSEGNIIVNGFDSKSDSQLVKNSLGFLSGNTGLYNRLTAEEMVKYYADLHSISYSEFKSNRDRLFSLLDMNTFSNRRIGKLSTGMKQKVNIARTMIHDPEVVVFDEPTSGLDVMASRSITTLIKG